MDQKEKETLRARVAGRGTDELVGDLVLAFASDRGTVTRFALTCLELSRRLSPGEVNKIIESFVKP